MRVDGMVGWYHQLHAHEFDQAPADGEGQGGLVCCSSWGHKESDTIEQLNNSKTLGVESKKCAFHKHIVMLAHCHIS